MRTMTLRSIHPLLLATLLGALALAGLALPASAATSTIGATPQTAAASCWEIKHEAPSTPDGVYWILTPQLQVPTKIYCDQTTSGGGWELVGRGRNGWSLAYNGKGTPAEVAETVTGTAAFAPRQLDSTVINGLLGGRRFDSYSDGVRVRRATNQAGTSWQETTWTYRANSRDRWTWSFGAGLPIDSVDIGGSTGSNTTTYEFGADSSYKRLWTYEDAKNGYVRGFNFGQRGIGSTAADSYIYSKVAGGYYGTPFSQVFIRPKLLSSDLTFGSIPDSGTSAQTIKAVPRNGALTSTWGVTGTGAAGTGENSTEVQAFAQIGNTMYVGGNFTTVQKGAAATGADKVSQPYLAAFDATTGAYIPGFAPVLNNQVKALAALPGGKLAVGGEFTSVGGTARKGLVVVDPATGALDTTWTTNLENRMTDARVSVRGLDTADGYLYLTGAFTHFTHPGAGDVYAKHGARVALSTGIADKRWNPEFNGTGTALDVSDDGARVYFAGYFTTAKGVTADRAAAFSTSTGAPRVTPTWQPTFSTSGSARYQQAVKQVGDKVWLGGSQHSMFSYDTTTFALENAHITKQGGDLQAIESGNGLVFGGCHCLNWNYSDTKAYDTTAPGSTNITWSQADKIFFVGAWDTATGDYVPDFTPEMKARNGMGAWALKVASDGTLWAGGSLTSAVKENGANQWVGGFVRFAVRPHTAPAKPSQLKVTLKGSDASVSWDASTTSGVTYEILRDDRVVATSASTDVTVTGGAANDRYFVRAVDDWDNRSASTAVARPTTAPVTTTLLPAGATWSYHFDKADAVPSAWLQPYFEASSWKTGAAPLGWGSGSIATDIDVPAGQTRAVASYHRTTFTIPAGATYGDVTLTTRADDGIAVHVNGTEVGRSNLPEGHLSGSSYALSAPNTAVATGAPVTFTVPVSTLKIGTNVVAVEVHSMYRATPSSSMDLAIKATTGDHAPAPASESTALIGNGSTWSYHFDNTSPVPDDWKTSVPAISGWPTGNGPLGWGSTGIATNIDMPDGTTRALTSYYRHDFRVTEPDAIKTLTVRTRADDGIAVYVNGTEVGRSNLPAGTLTAGSYASSAPNTATATANPVIFDVPVSLLKAGTNSIAVEVHSNYRATHSTSMALSLVAVS